MKEQEVMWKQIEADLNESKGNILSPTLLNMMSEICLEI